jgi:group I intron endonuclease
MIDKNLDAINLAKKELLTDVCSSATKFCIYILISPSQKMYIGKTKNFKQRMLQHESMARRNSKYPIHVSIRKYNFINFEKIIFSYFDTEERSFELEKKLILYFREKNFELYNITDGGEGNSGLKVSDEVKKILRQKSLGNKHGQGYKMTPEQKKNHSKRMINNKYRKNIKHTEATKQKISNSLKGEKNPFFGKHHTKETINNMTGSNNSLAKLSDQNVLEIRHNKDKSITELAKQYNVSSNTISRIKKNITYTNI